MSKVISLGSFFGGSFGVPGRPDCVYEYFALESDIAATIQGAEGCALVAFRTAAEAQQRSAFLSAQARIVPAKK